MSFCIVCRQLRGTLFNWFVAVLLSQVPLTMWFLFCKGSKGVTLADTYAEVLRGARNTYAESTLSANYKHQTTRNIFLETQTFPAKSLLCPRLGFVKSPPFSRVIDKTSSSPADAPKMKCQNLILLVPISNFYKIKSPNGSSGLSALDCFHCNPLV